MQKNPLVSVIINCLNGEKYLYECIKSVLNQNYKKWEIVFFDNNSTDNSYSVLRKYKDKRIKYFRSTKTHTLYKARNLAIKKSKGKLISFLDTDDWWVKSKLSKQVNFFLKDQTVDVLYSNQYIYYEKNKTKKIYIKNKLNHGKFTQKLLDKSEISIQTILIKKNVFNEIKFNNKFTIIGDLDFFVRLSLIRNISAIQEPLVYYRVHDTNLTYKSIDLNIKELKIWVSEKVKSKKFNLMNFSKVYQKIELLKVKKFLIEKNKLKAGFDILKTSLRILKLKLLN